MNKLAIYGFSLFLGIAACNDAAHDKGRVEDSTVSDDTASSVDKPEPDHEPNCGEPYLCDDGTYDQDGDGYCPAADCNDSNCAINLGAAEICDDLDNDCDERTDDIDNDLVETLGDVVDAYVDFDRDGWPSHKHRLMYVDNLNNYAACEDCYQCKSPFPIMYTADPDDNDTIPACLEAYYDYALVTESLLSYVTCHEDVFDPCDQLGDDGCIEDLPPQCVINEYDGDGACFDSVQYKNSKWPECPPEHE